MARRGQWPTESKGVFNNDLTGQEGSRPAERDPEHASVRAHNQETARGRMLYPARNPNTAQNMRIPHPTRRANRSQRGDRRP